MPTLQELDGVAILCSDLHLTLQQPACRADDDWMQVQADYLHQLKTIANRGSFVKGGPQLPIICAGDIFDRWNAQPELINFALEHLPDGMICIPGQHDLPNHQLDQVHRSGYGVLMEAKKIIDISNGCDYMITSKDDGISPPLVCHGFEWGREITPCEREPGRLIHLAVIHKYIWAKGHSYPGAPTENHLPHIEKSIKGYDAAVFGDNHKGFLRGNVLNCGGFIRRKSDEIDYAPRVGILYGDGTIGQKKLDTSGDRFHEKEKDREEIPINMAEFIAGLEELGEHGLNFREAVENHLRTEEISGEAKQIILKALEA